MLRLDSRDGSCLEQKKQSIDHPTNHFFVWHAESYHLWSDLECRMAYSERMKEVIALLCNSTTHRKVLRCYLPRGSIDPTLAISALSASSSRSLALSSPLLPFTARVLWTSTILWGVVSTLLFFHRLVHISCRYGTDIDSFRFKQHEWEQPKWHEHQYE